MHKMEGLVFTQAQIVSVPGGEARCMGMDTGR